MKSKTSPLTFVLLLGWALQSSAFTIPQRTCSQLPLSFMHTGSSIQVTTLVTPSTTRLRASAYEPQYENKPAKKKKVLYPNAGDIVRYYDLDGGKADGEVLVGKIAYIQEVLGSADKWAVEITQLEDVGDGFYAEYSSRQRSSKKTMRSIKEIAPIAASLVRSEGAYKVPRGKDGVPVVRAEEYDIDTYLGPFTGENAINQDVLNEDWETYTALKQKLIRQAVICSATGTLIAGLVKGPEDAAIYAAGALAGVSYLFLLSIKTDTLGSSKSNLGDGIANIRFATPLFVFMGVAIYNKFLLGDASPVVSATNIFTTVSPEQFGAIVIGFLTYRLPFFANQISDLLKDGDGILPGSAGMAMSLAKQDEEEQPALATIVEDLKTVLVVSGPQASGRTELVQRLIAESEGRFVTPSAIDRIEQGAKFELLESRDQLLTVDPTGRYGVTKEGILNVAKSEDSVVVVDASVETVKRLRKVKGLRLIGVWVGLDATDKFEANLKAQLDSGDLVMPEDEDETSFLRAKIKEIVKDIEYGIVSGIFEFTILNDDADMSIEQLREAAEYCFKG